MVERGEGHDTPCEVALPADSHSCVRARFNFLIGTIGGGERTMKCACTVLSMTRRKTRIIYTVGSKITKLRCPHKFDLKKRPRSARDKKNRPTHPKTTSVWHGLFYNTNIADTRTGPHSTVPVTHQTIYGCPFRQRIARRRERALRAR